MELKFTIHADSITPKVGMVFYGLMMFLSVLLEVRKIQKDFDFDLIDAHYMYPDCYAAVLVGRFLRKPVVVSARGSDVNLFSRFSIIRRLLIYVLLRADHVIAVSSALQRAIVQLGVSEEKVSVIPNGVDGGKFKKISKQKARQILGLPADGPVLLSVGGLTGVKGFHHLIRAFNILVEESKGIEPKLMIVGEGPSRNDLGIIISELGLSSHVQLVGAVPHERLYLWYNAADLFCLASEREGWPNVVLEALACGTPVVGTAVGGIPEIIVNEDIGLLTGREPGVMAARLREAMEKNWDRDRMVQYAERFTWNAAAARVRQVFDCLLSHAKFDAIVEPQCVSKK